LVRRGPLQPQVADSVEEVSTRPRSALSKELREPEHFGADVTGLHLLCVLNYLSSDDHRLIEVVGEKQRCCEDGPSLGERAAVAGTAVRHRVQG
jgi:hypothetical protein